jgi:hypothetical protein
VLRGRKRGAFIPREFEFYTCRACELLFVEPFSGFEIYNDAYYRGAGPDPFVDYETEAQSIRSIRLPEPESPAARHCSGTAGAGSVPGLRS